jgi:hypothetical protein
VEFYALSLVTALYVAMALLALVIGVAICPGYSLQAGGARQRAQTWAKCIVIAAIATPPYLWLEPRALGNALAAVAGFASLCLLFRQPLAKTSLVFFTATGLFVLATRVLELVLGIVPRESMDTELEDLILKAAGATMSRLPT